MSSIATTMLAVTPSSICARVRSRYSRGGGPALLLTRMSGSGQAANKAAWPSALATSALTGMILAPVAFCNSAAVASSRAASSPLITTSQPAAASACAQARPSPRLEAHTMALRPAIPRSMQELLGGRNRQLLIASIAAIGAGGTQSIGRQPKKSSNRLELILKYLQKYPATDSRRLYHTCNSFLCGRGLI